MAQFARYGYDSMQDDSLQEVMTQFAKYRYGNLQDDSLQDVDTNTVCKNMIHSFSLNDMWIHIITRVENA